MATSGNAASAHTVPTARTPNSTTSAASTKCTRLLVLSACKGVPFMGARSGVGQKRPPAMMSSGLPGPLRPCHASTLAKAACVPNSRATRGFAALAAHGADLPPPGVRAACGGAGTRDGLEQRDQHQAERGEHDHAGQLGQLRVTADDDAAVEQQDAVL